MEGQKHPTVLYTEDDLQPLSALQHLLFCERQCALIYLEQQWAENRLTVEGRHQHERVHQDETESRGDVRIATGVRLRSLRLGLSGMADVVEFHRVADGEAGAELPGVIGRWRPYPVEHKRGRPKENRCDEVQLCAQALCLEERFGLTIPEGALFYGKLRRRQRVTFDAGLRQLTETTAARLHQLLASGRTPAPVILPHCENCSLHERCLPEAVVKGKVVNEYLMRMTVQ